MNIQIQTQELRFGSYIKVIIDGELIRFTDIDTALKRIGEALKGDVSQ